MTGQLAQKAHAQADQLCSGDGPCPNRPGVPRRTVAIGDPQTTAARFFEVLEARDLLGDDGFLRPDVQLVSMGDHFDYNHSHPAGGGGKLEDAQRDGLRILSWLAAHAPDQVVVLLGNHDVSRVAELCEVTDERFREARPLARELAPLQKQDPQAFRARVAVEWVVRFPELPNPGLVARDYSSFTESQRALVRKLLLAARFSLAVTAGIGGRRGLLTHAGVTTLQLSKLDLADSSPAAAIADALERLLSAAVDQVRDGWHAGLNAPLSLAPLHIPGAIGADGRKDVPEGGGLLYHRPHDPGREGVEDPVWERDPELPRRFHPEALPIGLVQVAGHTGHAHCFKEMPRWREPGMTEQPGHRTLASRNGVVRYRRGVHAALPDEGVVYLIDAEIHKAERPEDVPILELGAGSLRAR